MSKRKECYPESVQARILHVVIVSFSLLPYPLSQLMEPSGRIL